MAIWHMLQGFLGAFPQYAPNTTTMGVHLFAESYGGKYGPAFASIWEQQNLRRSNGTISKSGTIQIKLASLGIVNGCVDDLVQGPYYPAMAVNNTYGLTAINPTRAKLAIGSFYASGGCQDQIKQCRAAVNAQDPNNEGDVSTVNSICSNAYSFCSENVIDPYEDAGRSIYDIAHLLPESFPPSTYLEYLNTASFQSAIGSPVNYTETNYQVVSAFTSTGDYERESYIPDIANLLNAGVRVGLMYGDRDYICNWLGGEALSLAVAAQTSSSYASLSCSRIRPYHRQYHIYWRCCSPIWESLVQSYLRCWAQCSSVSTRDCVPGLRSYYDWHICLHRRGHQLIGLQYNRAIERNIHQHLTCFSFSNVLASKYHRYLQ